MKYTEDKPFSTTFKVDYKIFTLLYICYKYKFPISYFLTMYELFGEMSLFTFKALACNKSISLTDNAFTKIVDQSKLLYRQIHSGITVRNKIRQLSALVKNGYKIQDEIPDKPEIDLSVFSSDYKDFVENYMLVNIADIFSEELKLCFNTQDLYEEIKSRK